MSAATDLQKLILWARKNSITWDTLTVGNVTISGSDLRLSESLPQPKVTDTPAKPQTLAQRYGAELLEDASKNEGVMSTSVVEED